MEKEHNIYTIPNLLTLFRLCLIPVLVWLYCFEENLTGTAAVLLVSSLTDVADGFIARQFHMGSKLGEILDPVADKLTQGAMLLCLVFHFPLMLMPLSEIFFRMAGMLNVWRIREEKAVRWHGKIATFTLYVMLLIHLAWIDIPMWLSTALIMSCMAAMVLY